MDRREVPMEIWMRFGQPCLLLVRKRHQCSGRGGGDLSSTMLPAHGELQHQLETTGVYRQDLVFLIRKMKQFNESIDFPHVSGGGASGRGMLCCGYFSAGRARSDSRQRKAGCQRPALCLACELGERRPSLNVTLLRNLC